MYKNAYKYDLFILFKIKVIVITLGVTNFLDKSIYEFHKADFSVPEKFFPD